MKKEFEIEYKVLVTKEQLNKMIKKIGYTKKIIQINYYFDTINRDIKKARYSLRIRKINNEFEYTLKTPSPIEGSIEYNYKTDKYDPEYFKNFQAHFDTININYQDLVQIGKLKTIRRIKQVEEGLWCFDMNFYGANRDFEIEFEVKDIKYRNYFKEKLLENDIKFILNKRGKNSRATKKA